MRRKQTSIRSSRSALPHRYLRSISWISWVHRPQPSTSWVFHLVPQSAHTSFFAAVPISQGRNSCAPATATRKTEQLLSDFSQEKEKQPSPLLSHASCVPLLLRCSARELSACRPRSICGRSAVRFSRRFLRPSHKQKMRARSIAPRTRSPRLSNVLKKA